jgi:1,2-phenylacetyl-CoA epoxidase catalytic subunit
VTPEELEPAGLEGGLDPALADLLTATVGAKRMAASMYLGLRDRAPAPTGAIALSRIAEDETEQAAAIDALRGVRRQAEPVSPAVSPGCSPYDQTWGSGLMTAFALDQAATAALVALETSSAAAVAAVARRIVQEERQHQSFALGAFRALADAEPGLGMRLAKEMIENRDWIKEMYPRRARIVTLAEAGLLAADAPRLHDSFLASLGDRIQDALGVLGDL